MADSDIVAAALRHRLQLNRTGKAASKEAVEAYSVIYKRLVRQSDQLTKRIAAARKAGEAVTPLWLQTEATYQSLLAQIDTEVSKYTNSITDGVTQATQAAATKAVADTAQIATLIEVPVSGTAAGRFLPTGAVEQLAGATADTAPVGKLLKRIAPNTADEVRRYLLAETTAGTSHHKIAAGIKQRLQVPGWRAATIVRTEQMRAYRETARDRYQAAGITQWQWIAALDDRTCAACFAMHGKKFATQARMPTHPNCRCTLIPVVDNGPSVIDGETEFARLPSDTQRKILGPAKHKAWKSGVQLNSFVEAHTHPVWGPSLRQRSLRNAIGPTAAARFFRRR